MPDATFVQYESFDDGQIVRIMLDRPNARNAQNRGMLVELDDACLRADADNDVRVVLGGVGNMFSAGHDMGRRSRWTEMFPGPGQHPTRQINGATRKGANWRDALPIVPAVKDKVRADG